MRADAEQYFSTGKAKIHLLIAAFLAPVMFLVHELVTYIFVPWDCSAAGKTPTYLFTAGSLVLAALGAWVGWRSWRGAGGTLSFELGGPIGRTRFVGFVSALFSALFFLAIIATSVPNWIMDACHP